MRYPFLVSEKTVEQAPPNRSKSLRRRILAFGALLAIVLLFQPARAHLRAASLLVRFSDRSATGAVADYAKHEVDEEPGEIMVRGEPVRVRLFVPRGVDNPGGVVLVHGVHRKGIDEPRLLNFARTISASGVVVFTPEVREIADYRIDPASIETIGEAVRALRARQGEKVGVMGMSFAGGLSLLTAADPRFKSDVRFVVAVGAHHDLSRVLRFFVSNAIERPDGTKQELKAHDYGALVLVYSYIEDFFPKADLEAARATIRFLLWEDEPDAKARAEGLSAPSRLKMQKLIDHDIADIVPEMQAVIRREEGKLGPVSPRGHLKDIEGKVFLLHGAGDSVIPATETLWLADEMRRENAGNLGDAVVSQAIQHVELHGTPTAYEQAEIVHFMSEVLSAADP
jgi:acetyl esterase/lipase